MHFRIRVDSLQVALVDYLVFFLVVQLDDEVYELACPVFDIAIKFWTGRSAEQVLVAIEEIEVVLVYC